MQVFNFKTLYISIGQNFPKFTIFKSFRLKFHFYYKPTNQSIFIIEKMEHAGIFQNIEVILRNFCGIFLTFFIIIISF